MTTLQVGDLIQISNTPQEMTFLSMSGRRYVVEWLGTETAAILEDGTGTLPQHMRYTIEHNTIFRNMVVTEHRLPGRILQPIDAVGPPTFQALGLQIGDLIRVAESFEGQQSDGRSLNRNSIYRISAIDGTHGYIYVNYVRPRNDIQSHISEQDYNVQVSTTTLLTCCERAACSFGANGAVNYRNWSRLRLPDSTDARSDRQQEELQEREDRLGISLRVNDQIKLYTTSNVFYTVIGVMPTQNHADSITYLLRMPGLDNSNPYRMSSDMLIGAADFRIRIRNADSNVVEYGAWRPFVRPDSVASLTNTTATTNRQNNVNTLPASRLTRAAREVAAAIAAQERDQRQDDLRQEDCPHDNFYDVKVGDRLRIADTDNPYCDGWDRIRDSTVDVFAIANRTKHYMVLEFRLGDSTYNPYKRIRCDKLLYGKCEVLRKVKQPGGAETWFNIGDLRPMACRSEKSKHLSQNGTLDDFQVNQKVSVPTVTDMQRRVRNIG